MGVQMTQRALTWCIFAMLVLTVPVIFYVFMWIGVYPLQVSSRCLLRLGIFFLQSWASYMSLYLAACFTESQF